jgi:hypothetical protein
MIGHLTQNLLFFRIWGTEEVFFLWLWHIIAALPAVATGMVAALSFVATKERAFVLVASVGLLAYLWVEGAIYCWVLLFPVFVATANSVLLGDRSLWRLRLIGYLGLLVISSLLVVIGGKQMPEFYNGSMIGLLVVLLAMSLILLTKALVIDPPTSVEWQLSTISLGKTNEVAFCVASFLYPLSNPADPHHGEVLLIAYLALSITGFWTIGCAFLVGWRGKWLRSINNGS